MTRWPTMPLETASFAILGLLGSAVALAGEIPVGRHVWIVDCHDGAPRADEGVVAGAGKGAGEYAISWLSCPGGGCPASLSPSYLHWSKSEIDLHTYFGSCSKTSTSSGGSTADKGLAAVGFGAMVVAGGAYLLYELSQPVTGSHARPEAAPIGAEEGCLRHDTDACLSLLKAYKGGKSGIDVASAWLYAEAACEGELDGSTWGKEAAACRMAVDLCVHHAAPCADDPHFSVRVGLECDQGDGASCFASALLELQAGKDVGDEDERRTRANDARKAFKKGCEFGNSECCTALR